MIFVGFPSGSDGKESARHAGDPGSLPGFGEDPLEKGWQPIAVFFPGEFHGQRSLAGCSTKGRQELDMTERLTLSLYDFYRSSILSALYFLFCP